VIVRALRQPVEHGDGLGDVRSLVQHHAFRTHGRRRIGHLATRGDAVLDHGLEDTALEPSGRGQPEPHEAALKGLQIVAALGEIIHEIGDRRNGIILGQAYPFPNPRSSSMIALRTAATAFRTAACSISSTFVVRCLCAGRDRVQSLW
jgi:hypothetical protein